MYSRGDSFHYMIIKEKYSNSYYVHFITSPKEPHMHFPHNQHYVNLCGDHENESIFSGHKVVDLKCIVYKLT